MGGDTHIVTTVLPDGREISCVNDYEVAFNWHEIISDDLTAQGLALPPRGTYIDIGANIGLFCLNLRDLCPTARIYAFEPMPAPFKALRENAERIGGDIEVFRKALGATPGEMSFDFYPAITALSTADTATGEALADGLRELLFNNTGAEEIRAIVERTVAPEMLDDDSFAERLFRKETVTARVDTLDNVVAQHGIGTIDLLKIDTEGHEQAVLDGIDRTLWPRIRQLLIEIHRGPEERDRVSADLENRGYELTIKNHPMAQGGASVSHIYAHR